MRNCQRCRPCNCGYRGERPQMGGGCGGGCGNVETNLSKSQQSHSKY